MVRSYPGFHSWVDRANKYRSATVQTTTGATRITAGPHDAEADAAAASGAAASTAQRPSASVCQWAVPESLQLE